MSDRETCSKGQDPSRHCGRKLALWIFTRVEPRVAVEHSTFGRLLGLRGHAPLASGAAWPQEWNPFLGPLRPSALLCVLAVHSKMALGTSLLADFGGILPIWRATRSACAESDAIILRQGARVILWWIKKRPRPQPGPIRLVANQVSTRVVRHSTCTLFRRSCGCSSPSPSID
jgi:hypothetical protein